MPADYAGEERRHDVELREAFDRGRAQMRTEAELQAHERRLNALNGSIDRHARQAGELKDSIEELREKVEEVATMIATRAAVEQERVSQIKTANERQISNRTFWLGVVAIIVAFAGAYLASHGFHT